MIEASNSSEDRLDDDKLLQIELSNLILLVQRISRVSLAGGTFREK